MNVEQLRDFCLEIAPDVEGKMPFKAFRYAQAVLAFYVEGHMFCYFDIDRFDVVSVKCAPDDIPPLRAAHDFIGNPYNLSPKHWIGIRVAQSPACLTEQLVLNSYRIVKQKYNKRRK